MDDKIKQVIGFIARNAERESAFLWPNPAWNIEATGLLDAIAEIYGVSKDDVGAVFNPVREEVESRKGPPNAKVIGLPEPKALGLPKQ